MRTQILTAKNIGGRRCGPSAVFIGAACAILFLNSAPARASAAPRSRWIGVAVEHIPSAMSRLLGLKRGQGLFVDAVLPGSPAARAGLRPHDLLIANGNKALVSRRQLIALANTAVRAGQHRPQCALEYIRNGRRRHVTLIPARRPRAFSVRNHRNILDVSTINGPLPLGAAPQRLAVQGKTMDIGPGVVIDLHGASPSTMESGGTAGHIVTITQWTGPKGNLHSVLATNGKSYRLTPGAMATLPENLRPMASLAMSHKIKPAAPQPAAAELAKLERQLAQAQRRLVRLQEKLRRLGKNASPRKK